MKHGKRFVFFYSSRRHKLAASGISLALAFLGVFKPFSSGAQTTSDAAGFDQLINRNAHQMLTEGRQTFRYETFGSELFWGDTLKLHQAVAQLSPRDALGLGLPPTLPIFSAPSGCLNRPSAGKKCWTTRRDHG